MSNSMAISIEFGQLTSGLSGILGVGQGMASDKYLSGAFHNLSRKMDREFGAAADAAASEGTIAHVYEYSPTPSGIDPTPAGRLWELTWHKRRGDIVGNIIFKQSRAPSTPDPALQAEAQAAGKSVSSHLFPNKAAHLETTQKLVAEAGIQRETTRLDGGPPPDVLVYLGRDGEPRFANRLVRDNEFFGKFATFFTSYWISKLENQGKVRMQRGMSRVAGYGAGEVRKLVRKTSVFRPRPLPPGAFGVIATDKGLPYRGIRLSEKDIKIVEKKVGRFMIEELGKVW